MVENDGVFNSVDVGSNDSTNLRVDGGDDEVEVEGRYEGNKFRLYKGQIRDHLEMRG